MRESEVSRGRRKVVQIVCRDKYNEILNLLNNRITNTDMLVRCIQESHSNELPFKRNKK